jgi:hypothetical protein
MHRKEDGAKALFTDPSDGKPIRNQRICLAPTNASIENRAVSFTTILDCSKQVFSSTKRNWACGSTNGLISQGKQRGPL